MGRGPLDLVLIPLVAGYFVWRRRKRAAAFALVLALATPVLACATVSRGALVTVANEEALIVWDEAKKVEHFIRRASFSQKGKREDFGFLVPTPSVPELAEVSGEIFPKLVEAVRATTQVRYSVELSVLCANLIQARSHGAAGAVTVLRTDHVAGYEAAVLEASSATALADWIKANGYSTRPGLVEWLAPYVAKGWKITAFKIAPAATVDDLVSKTVRMSFAVDRPFFPYREPADSKSPTLRRLRVFFAGPSSVKATLAPEIYEKTFISREFGAPMPLGELLAGTVPSPPTTGWLTVLLDRTSDRSEVTDELFFDKDSSSPLYPSRTQKIWLPLDLAIPALFLGAVIYRRTRRKTS